MLEQNLFEELFLTLDINSPASGVLEKWYVSEGQWILKGQKMGKLSDKTLVVSPVNGKITALDKVGKNYLAS